MADAPPRDSGIRDWIALGITSISVIGVVALAIVGIVAQKETAKDLLAILLPVIGTWVGTVLAYYFSKENFEAASRSVSALASQLTPTEKLQSKPVTAAMISRGTMFFKRGPASNVNLVQTLQDVEAAAKGDRIPILDANDAPLYLVHRSLIDRFLATKTLAESPPDARTFTLADVLNETTIQATDGKTFKDVLEKSWVVVSDTATLADAKKAMDAVDVCQDVFVTKGGTGKEPVLGWITNNIIEDNAKV